MPNSRVIPKQTPVSPGQDCRYTIRRNPARNDEWWVYYKPQGADPIPSDQAHEQLVECVNALKEAEGNSAGGSFSINEHSQVIARMNAPAGYRGNAVHVIDIAGGTVFRYSATITFMNAALDPSAMPAEGALWPGPLCGATYSFAAPRSPKLPSNNLDEVWTNINGGDSQLSAHCIGAYPPSTGPLADFLTALRRQIPQGGRFRVNECGRAFTPEENRFIGIVPLGNWFRPIQATD